jgi:threonine aldolase
MAKIHNIAQKHGIPIHLDGARLFNAATYLDTDAKQITRYCDSVMFCLSKGLCAPVGSMLAGNQKFIDQARKKRKLMGRGLRQAGILAAAGLVALRDMRKRLAEDHENALLLGKELAKLPGITVNQEDIHINMVFFDMSKTGLSDETIVREFLQKGIKINSSEGGLMRFVTHYWVSQEDIRYVVETLKNLITVS